MGVAHSQTVEDGGPRRPIVWQLLREGTPEETLRIAMVIRRPFSTVSFTRRLVLHACIETLSLTASLRSSDDDGANL